MSIETATIRKIHNALRAAGFSLFRVNDGEENTETTGINEAIKIFESVDDVVIFYYHNGLPKGEGRICGAVQYIGGNGEDVANDWSGVLDSVITPLILGEN